MGPALTNLKDLLKMPYGCGEQNMASFAPNIFVLQYFYNTNMDVSRVLDDALRYMRVGRYFGAQISYISVILLITLGYYKLFFVHWCITHFKTWKWPALRRKNELFLTVLFLLDVYFQLQIEIAMVYFHCYLQMEQMLLQNVDTASVLLYALFIMSYDATHRLYFRFCDCG